MPRKSQAQPVSARLTQELIGTPSPTERTVEVLLSVGRALSGLDHSAAVVDSVGYLLPDVFNADAAALWVHDRATGCLWTRKTCHEVNWPAPMWVLDHEGPCGYVFQQERAVCVGNATKTTLWSDSGVSITTKGIAHSLLVAPVFDRAENCLGVMQIADARADFFAAADLALLEAVVRQIGLCLENALRYEAQTRQFDSLIRALMAAIDARDAVTIHHSANVANYAVGIGQLLGLDHRHQERLRVAAFLHDVGKLGTPDRLLTKAGPLEPQEMEEVKKHAAYTRRILSQVEFITAYDDLAHLAAAHHEKLDGSGYPDGLAGTQIPLDARVLTVADMYHALTQARHHRPGMAPEKAVALLDSFVPDQLDGRCVDALRRFLGMEVTSTRAA